MSFPHSYKGINIITSIQKKGRNKMSSLSKYILFIVKDYDVIGSNCSS